MLAAVPLISVIIPVYNRRDVIGRAVESVLAQTCTDCEVLVVDDGSNDDTREFLQQEFGQRQSMRVLRCDANSGVSAARNSGLAVARGEWMAFLDSDDEWKPRKLERQLEALNETGLKVCHTEEIWVRNGVRVNPHKHHRKYGGRIFLQAVPLCVMSPSSIVIHRSVFDRIGHFDESLPACEDYDFFLRLTCRYDVVYLEEGLMVKYGGHEDQLSRAHYAMDRFRVKALDRILGEESAPLTEEEREAARATLVKKARIVRDGAVRRENSELAASMNDYLERWQQCDGS